MKIFQLTLITLAAYILQTTVLHQLLPVVPNLLMSLAVCYALVGRRLSYAAIYGAACGLLLDISCRNVFGLHILMCLYISLLTAYVSGKFFKGKFITSVAFVAAASFLYEFAYYVLCFGMWGVGSAASALVSVVLPVTGLNTLVCAVLFFVMRHVTPEEQIL